MKRNVPVNAMFHFLITGAPEYFDVLNNYVRRSVRSMPPRAYANAVRVLLAQSRESVPCGHQNTSSIG
jgi:hypothetical protein